MLWGKIGFILRESPSLPLLCQRDMDVIFTQKELEQQKQAAGEGNRLYSQS